MLILSGTHQPSSGDDESVFTQLSEERLDQSLFASVGSRRLVSPVGLTSPQLLTADMEKIRQTLTQHSVKPLKCEDLSQAGSDC